MKNPKKIPIITLATCLSALSANAQIETGLVGHWQFEDNLTETSGAHAAGLHDGAETGTNPVAYIANPNTDFGQALDLDGTNGVYIPNSANVLTDGVTTNPTYAGTFDADINTANAMTVSFWVNGSPAAWSPFVCKFGEDNDNGNEGWQVRRRAGASLATFTLRNTGGEDDPSGSNTAATASGWRHITAVWDGASGTRKLYIDGVEDTSITIASGDTSTGGPGNALNKLLTFGMRDGGLGVGFQNYLTGQLDDVAIWSRALTELEIKHITNNPIADVIGQADTDMDGLLDNQETALGTNPNLADTDSDGVNDFDEVQAGSDPLNDNDHDLDGLDNSEETSGSANPFSNEPTDWNSDDSDGDGILDGEEIIAGVDGYVTNPNDSDTDDDNWSDGDELGATPPTDPTNPSSYPATSTGLIAHWEFEDNLDETSGTQVDEKFHEGIPYGTINYTTGPDTSFGQALDLSLNGDNGVYIKNSSNLEADGTTPNPTYASTFDADVNAANSMTVSLWANGDIGRWTSFVSKHGEGSEGWQVRQRDRNADAVFTLRSTNGVDDPAGDNVAATNIGWRHILAVWDGAAGTRKIYINGVEDTTFSANVGANDASSGGPGNAIAKHLAFGMRDNGASAFTYFFHGQLDDVAIWTRALTPSEALLLANNPLSVVLSNTDTDGDGLFDDDEVNIWETDPSDPDSDDDGVNDFDEVNADPISNPNADNDYDADGLMNSEETSGSANPWIGGVNVGAPGETTVWNQADTDLDGILDGEEVIAGTDTYVTDPNNADTDGDGWSDGDEVNATPPSDPTNMVAVPTNQDWIQDLQGYWKLDGDLLDSGYLAQDGVMGGNAVQAETYVAGMFGQAVDLDVSNKDRVEITGNEDYFDANGSDVTVSIWMTADSFNTNWQGLFSKGEQSWRLARYDTTSGLGFAAGTVGDAPGAVLAAANPILGDGWHHVVGVLEDGVGFSIYIDGYLIGSDPDAPNAGNVPLAVWIGGNPTNSKTWDGNVDDAAIWKRALTAEEIYTVFAEGMNGNSLQDVIDNNVPPVTEVPEPEQPPVVIESYGLNESGDFSMTVSGLDPAKGYEMWVTPTLDPVNWYEITTTYVTGVEEATFTETGALGFSTTGFYSIFDVTPTE